METPRRNFLIGTGAMLSMVACRSSQHASTLPGTYWPNVDRPDSESRHVPPVAERPAAEPPAQRPSGHVGTPQNPIPRANWTTASVGTRNIYPMNGINRITIHHEGYKGVWFDGFDQMAAHMDLIRRSHMSRKFADIGYHYVIDRAGRVWEGRPIRFQGAHVSENNEHNIGVMCVGNFEIQEPTGAQVQALANTVAHLRRLHGVASNRIFTHRELTPTVCPGRNLQPRIVALRHSNAFA